MESRMLTTAMLTAINDLRKGKKSIFFLATNRLRAFDSAIIRPGRFDMQVQIFINVQVYLLNLMLMTNSFTVVRTPFFLQLFVGTPNLEARVILFRGQLANVPADQSTKDVAERSFRSFISSVWQEDIMFFNYLESLQFASACADVVAKGNKLTEDIMAAILKSQAHVMTVRGTVRDEYVASMGLSRL
jgi:hypothetical protein